MTLSVSFIRAVSPTTCVINYTCTLAVPPLRFHLTIFQALANVLNDLESDLASLILSS